MKTVDITPKWEGLIRYMIAVTRERNCAPVIAATFTAEIHKLGETAVDLFLKAIDAKEKAHWGKCEIQLKAIAREADREIAKRKL